MRGLESATVNPVAIFGPALSPHVSGSFVLFHMLFSGRPYPDLPLNVVDVRDVADLHIRAMTHPRGKGERFIATADGQISLSEMAVILREESTEMGGGISRRILSGWMVTLASLFSRRAREGAAILRVNRNVSNGKARVILGWKPAYGKEEVIRASIESMVRYGIVR